MLPLKPLARRRELGIEQAQVGEHGQVAAGLWIDCGEEVVVDLAFETLMARIAGIDVDRIAWRRIRNLLRLDAILDVDAEQADVVEQPVCRRAMHAGFPGQHMGRIRIVDRIGRGVAERRADVEVADRAPALRDVEVGFVAAAEIIAEAESEQGHVVGDLAIDEAARQIRWPDRFVDLRPSRARCARTARNASRRRSGTRFRRIRRA